MLNLDCAIVTLTSGSPTKMVFRLCSESLGTNKAAEEGGTFPDEALVLADDVSLEPCGLTSGEQLAWCTIRSLFTRNDPRVLNRECRENLERALDCNNEFCPPDFPREDFLNEFGPVIRSCDLAEGVETWAFKKLVATAAGRSHSFQHLVSQPP